MKTVFFELEEWELEYLQNKMTNQDIELYTTSFKDTDSKTMFDAEIIATFIFQKFTKEVLDKFPKLKLITTMSTGFDHIDLEECKKRGIKVCNVPAYGENTVAEHVFGLILNLSRNIHKAYIRTQKDKFSYKGLMGFDLKGKTIGVIGTGRIGLNSINIAKGFQMNVIAFDAFPKEGLEHEYKFTYVPFEELLAKADIITIHVPLNKHTRHLINSDSISKMKKGVIIINTARGDIVDNSALIAGLDSKQIGGAGLDVLEGEMLIKEEKQIIHSYDSLPQDKMALLLENHDLMHKENVIVTPHLAFYSKEALYRILDTTLTNIYDLIENREFANKLF